MMRKILAVTIFLSCQILSAQGQNAPHALNYPAIDAERRLQQDSFEKWATQPEPERQAAERRETDEKFREFYSKAQHFVTLWKELTVAMNDQKTFNVKLAKQVSKAFHDLEKSEGWPAGRSK
jgi:hypothetical protein